LKEPFVGARPGAQQRDEQDRLMYRHDAAQAEWFDGSREGCSDDRAEGRSGR
jgi:hypothetical protein